MFESLEGQSIFEGVLNRNQQKTYRKEYLCLIEPKPIDSGDQAIIFSLKTGFSEKPVTNGYAAPFLQVLERVLQCEDVLHCIDNPLQSQDGHFRTVLDGFWYRSHPVVAQDPFTLAFVSYGDDVSPGDTLSVKGSKQQLRSFTWTLGNVYPWLRSTLRCIFPIAFCKKKCVSNEDALEDFISGINKLSSEEGVTFNINGKPRTFHGILLFMVGDTPASANFAGTKETYGAWCPCRQCLVNKDNIFEHFQEERTLLRNKELHNQHLAAVCPEDDEENLMEDDTEDSVEGNPSVMYGVNSRSCLLKVNYFDITKCLPQDIMHVLGEGGVLDVNIRLLLTGCISRKFSLKHVNQYLDSVNYGHFKKDKPAEIKQDHLSNNLRQTASQMFLLAHLIPFALFGHAKAAELMNYIRLLMIVNICLSSDATEKGASKLRKLIHDFLCKFKELYGVERMTLKFHFLTHLPKQILLFGCLTQQWAMRFEGFHAMLKRLFKILHNSTNLPLSLMERILTRMLHEMESSPSGKFLYPGHETKLGNSIQFKEFQWKDAIKSAVPTIKDEDRLQTVNHLKFFGHLYKPEDIVRLKLSTPPAVGAILNIYLYGNIFLLLCSALKVVGFNVNLNAYEIQTCPVPSVVAVRLSPEIVNQPLLTLKQQGRWYVILISCSDVEDSELEK